MFQNTLFQIGGQELRHVVSGVPKSHLRKVVRAEGKELGARGRDLVGNERCPRNLNHRADAVVDDDFGGLKHFGGGRAYHLYLVRQLRGGTHEGDHYIRKNRPAAFLVRASGLENRAHLHLSNFGIGNREPAPAEPEHGVDFRELFDSLHDFVFVRPGVLRQKSHDFVQVAVREELVKRRVQQPNRDWEAVHRGENAGEVGALER
mmetsp:Transcript_1888/g.6518  ORF Transcript_1888/g.6518 Transcript_1888/m.6518 type:complete len:205 (-) Transcript_1888:2010-2624(-)